MKIAYIINYFNEFLSYEENCLPFELFKLGHQVRIITSDRNRPFRNYNEIFDKIAKNRFVGPGKTILNGVEIVRLPSYFEFKNRQQLLMRGFADAIGEFHPDIVHSVGLYTTATFGSLFLQKRFNYSLIIASDANYFNMEPLTFYKRFFYWLVRIFIYKNFQNRVSFFLSISEEAKEVLIDVFGIQPSLVKIGPYCADPDFFCFKQEGRDRIRNGFNIKPGDLLICYVGKIYPLKDLKNLILAASPILRRYDDVKLLIVGSGPKEHIQFLKALSGNLIDQNKIIFHEFIPKKELADFFSACDVGVWPRQFSQIIPEAMAASLPIIVCEDKSSSYLCENNVGFTFPKGDIGVLSSILENITNDRQMLKDLRKPTREIIIAKYSWRKRAEGCIEIYNEAIRGRSGAIK